MIYLIRHLQSEANLKRIWGGDYPLTDKGIKDAYELKKRLTIHPDVLIVSPLIRAQQTAAILFPQMPVIIDDAFREIHFGDYENTPMKDDETLKIYQTETSRLSEFTHGDDLKERADKAISRLQDYLPQGDVAVVCHDTLIRSVICRLKGESLDNMPKYKPLLPNGSILSIFPTMTMEITDNAQKIVI